MKKRLLTSIAFLIATMSFGQFSTGFVNITANRTVKIDTNPTTVTLTMTGPNTVWLGLGFGGLGMASVSDMFIWSSSANRDYTPSGTLSTPSADAAAAQSWTIVSDAVVGTVRTVVATRPLVSPGDYTFLNDASTIPIIYAQGSSSTFGYHGNAPHASTSLTRSILGVEDFTLNATVIFPNPSNGVFTVSTKTALEKIVVYSQTGAVVKTINVNSIEATEVNVKGLQAGVYFLELNNSSEKSWKKIIVN
jgi:hypothetical protein